MPGKRLSMRKIADSDESDHVVRRKAITHSGPKGSSIPMNAHTCLGRSEATQVFQIGKVYSTVYPGPQKEKWPKGVLSKPLGHSALDGSGARSRTADTRIMIPVL